MMPVVEPTALERLLRPMSRGMSKELARDLAMLKVDGETQNRYETLADGHREGTLTTAEESELEDLVQANSVLSVLKTEARLLLESPAA